MDQNTATAAFILRLALGIMSLAHGLLKVFVFTLPGTVGFFEQVGFPGWTAYLVVAVEIVAGLLLIAGVAVRQTALVLVPIMLGATYVHLGNGWLFSSPNGGWEYPAYLTVLAIAQALLGPGRFALDLKGFKTGGNNA
jgi:putative oxidoreductase